MQREILVDSATPEVRIAVLEDGVLTELFIERPTGRGLAGNIYKGRVANVLPGMQSAFVDIGLERHAFLYVEDIASGNEEYERLLDLEAEDEPAPACRPDPPPRPAIEDLLKEGQEIVVQVRKETSAGKGARIASHVSLPGRLLVYLPGLARVGVSRRIEDLEERDRLKGLIKDLARELGMGGGFIVRTAGQGLTADEFLADARNLAGVWEEIGRRAACRPAPALLHEEAGAVARVLRDLFNHDVRQVLVDAEEVYLQVVESVGRTQPALAPRIRRYEGSTPIFEEHGVKRQLDRALRPRVWLRSGGSIVINQTEALVAVDVNTGKYVGTRRLEETILRTNLEAAQEIVRQVRLRDLGGIIVIDFIDMEEEASRAEVVAALERELRKDRSRSRMLQISEFGLVEITRQRTRRSLEGVLLRPCPACHGSGRVKSFETIFFEILREIRKLWPLLGRASVLVRAHPDVAGYLEGEREALAAALGGGPAASGTLVIQADPSLRHDQFNVDGA
jgi:ribonuclease G